MNTRLHIWWTCSIALALTGAVTGCGDGVSSAALDTENGTQDVSSAPTDAAGCESNCEPEEPDAELPRGGEDAPPADTTAVDPELATCAALCSALQCPAPFSEPACVDVCIQSGPDSCEFACLEAPVSCEAALLCLGSKAPAAAFDSGPSGLEWRDLVGDFSLQTDRGPFTLSTHVDGHHSFMVLTYASNAPFSQALWNSQIRFWMDLAPPTVHLLFLDAAGGQTEAMQAMRAQVDGALAKMSVAEQCHWRRHIHFATVTPQQTTGWLREYMTKKGFLAFGIDRFQRLRSVGLLQLVGSQIPQLSFLAYESRYYDFEWEREQILLSEDAKGTTQIAIYEGQEVGTAHFEVDLPPASTMATFDTFQIDKGAYCKDHQDANCGEWDYLSHLWLCERFTDANPFASEACEPGNTKPCTCNVPGGALTAEGERIHSCRTDGTGYGECDCRCDIEVGRWITTYSREGRWVSDHTPVLALLAEGGKQRFLLQSGNPYYFDLRFRFRDSGASERPIHVAPLFGGFEYAPDWSGAPWTKEVNVPAGATRVELFAWITGHGFAVDTQNCYEFCNHEHHFWINNQPFVQTFPMAGNTLGCAAQVDIGTVPNQYGTWYLGRGGWCPGMDVLPFRTDVTAAVGAGSNVKVDYKSLFQGKPWVPKVLDNTSNGFFGNVRMTSWLVFYGAK